MDITEKLSALINASNSVTGVTDTTITDAIRTLIQGYGQTIGNIYTRTGSFTTNTSQTATVAFQELPDLIVIPSIYGIDLGENYWQGWFWLKSKGNEQASVFYSSSSSSLWWQEMYMTTSGNSITFSQTAYNFSNGSANGTFRNQTFQYTAYYFGDEVEVNKYYTGSAKPANTFGQDGDLFLKI